MKGLGGAKSFQWVAVGCNGLAMFQYYAKGRAPCECGGGSDRRRSEEVSLRLRGWVEHFCTVYVRRSFSPLARGWIAA